MTVDPLAMDPRQTIVDATAFMADRRIKHLPVVENDSLVGIVTLSEALAALDSVAEPFRSQMPLRNCMRTNVVTVPAGASMKLALARMQRHDVGSLLVVNLGKVVGILTKTDVFRSYAHLLTVVPERNLRRRTKRPTSETMTAVAAGTTITV